jgi:hypothetical protein
VAAALDKIQFSGDLRLRYETFQYRHDPTGVDHNDRERFRYRLRLAARTENNDWVTVGMRMVSGDEDPVSTNQSLGDGDDFDTDDLRIDQAWAEFKLPELREGLSTKVVGGKISNPFTWKNGLDFLLWDGDITPEGGALKLKQDLGGYELFTNVGYLVVDEESNTSDPKVIPVQMGLHGDLGETLGFGMRGSMYWWRSLDAAFGTRNAAGGNLPGAFNRQKARIGELSAYFDANKDSADWPVRFYGQVIKNFTASSSLGVGDEDTAWLAGVELGNKKAQLGKIGFAWVDVEANSVVAVTTDSDMFDSHTNRQGWHAYYSRNVLRNTDFNVTVYDSQRIRSTGAFNGCRPAAGPLVPACGPFGESVADSRRLRWRTDLVVSF